MEACAAFRSGGLDSRSQMPAAKEFIRSTPHFLGILAGGAAAGLVYFLLSAVAAVGNEWLCTGAALLAFLIAYLGVSTWHSRRRDTQRRGSLG